MDDDEAAQSIVSDLDVPGFAVGAGCGVINSILPVVRATATRVADDLDVTLTVLPVDGNGGAMGTALAFAGELSRLRHDHLVRIHDVIPLAGQGAKPPCLVLATATARGGSLTELLERRAPLSVGEALTVVSPMAEAMTHLHQHGVVHGAFTTDSVLFTDRGMPLLADAAIDHLCSMPLVAMARSGSRAPEIVEGYEATTESDAYAFAAMAWTALVGSGPGWVGDRDDLTDLAPHLPAQVCSVLTSALSPDPGERPDIGEIVLHLADCGSAEPIDLAEFDAGRDVPSRIRALASRQSATHRAPRTSKATSAVVAVGSCLAVALALVALLLPGPFNLISRDALASTKTPEPATATPVVSDAKAMHPAQPVESAEASAPPPSGRQTSDEAAIIQTLVDARAQAWQSADPDLLANVHGVGSESMTADRGDLEAAMSAGAVLSDLSFVVSGVTVLQRYPRAATSLEEIEELTARMTVRREAVTVTAADGGQTRVPARSDNVNVTLHRESVGWRFVSWK